MSKCLPGCWHAECNKAWNERNDSKTIVTFPCGCSASFDRATGTVDTQTTCKFVNAPYTPPTRGMSGVG